LASNRRVDLDKVIMALESATLQEHHGVRRGHALDERRAFAQGRDRLKQGTQELIKGLRMFYKKLEDDIHFYVVLGFGRDAKNDDEDVPRDGKAVFNSLDRLAAAIEQDPVMTLEVPRVRRERRGHPPELWLKAV